MRAFACIAAVLLAATLAAAQHTAQGDQAITQVADAVNQHLADSIRALHPTSPPAPSSPPATPAPTAATPAPTAATPAPTAATPAPMAATTVPTTMPAPTTTPARTTPAPTTTPANITFTVPSALANTYEPNLIQEGSGNYSTNEPPSANATIARFVVIGDIGRNGAPGTPGQPQCSASAFGGDNDVQGALQQNETALLMDQVCKLVGGCSFVINTGDNFYQCGVYPNDYTRFQTDWIRVYQTSYTPTIAPLPWFNVFGSIPTQIQFDTSGASPVSAASPLAPAMTKLWNAPRAYYSEDYAINGITIRGIVLDANPFITAYNSPTQKYHTGYYTTNHNQAYEQAQIAFLQNALNTSTATYNFVTAHYPLFGGGVQYGSNASNAYPGEFNFWADVLATINDNSKKVVTYFNGHDHALTLGDPTTAAAQPWNNYITYQTSGAGSWGEPADSCTPSLYTNGGNGGFIIVTATAAQWRSDYYTLGSTYPQCTVTSYADKRPPTFSPNCALGKPNACCSVNGGADCYR